MFEHKDRRIGPKLQIFFAVLPAAFEHARYWLPLLLCQTLHLFAVGQSNSNDSLLRIIRENKRDLAEARALNSLALSYARTDMGRAKEYIYQAIGIAREGHFSTSQGAAYAEPQGANIPSKTR